MKIGILGTGEVGQSLGEAFLACGYHVMIGARETGNAKAAAWAAKAGPAASSGSFAEAAAFGDMVVLAILGLAVPDTLKAIGAAPFAGKVVIDATNPLDFSKGFPPGLGIAGDDSGGEAAQRLLPGARVVKAFNTAPNSLFYKPELAGGPPDMFIAGDDKAAKDVVAAICRDFGWGVVDTGGIKSSRWLEAMCIAWVMACAPTGNWRRAFRLLG